MGAGNVLFCSTYAYSVQVTSERFSKYMSLHAFFFFFKRLLKYVNQMIIKDLEKVTFQESPQCRVNFLLIVWKIQVCPISNFSITCMQYLIYSSHLLVENLGMQNSVMNSSHVVLLPY